MIASAEKRALAEELGAHATVDPALADDDPKTFTAALREANGGKPVDIKRSATARKTPPSHSAQTRRLVQSRLRTTPSSASSTPARTNHGLMSLGSVVYPIWLPRSV